MIYTTFFVQLGSKSLSLRLIRIYILGLSFRISYLVWVLRLGLALERHIFMNTALRKRSEQKRWYEYVEF